MGMACFKVINSLTILTDEDKQDPEKLLSALGDHFMPQKHYFVVWKGLVWIANQAEHETIDQYVVRLHQLAKSCEFEGLCESLICDRLVFGTQDSGTQRATKAMPSPWFTKMYRDPNKAS